MSSNNLMVKIWGGGGSYVARLNIDETVQHNRPTSSQITMNSKYPFHVHNGKASYYSGSCTATFVDNNDCYVTSEEDVAGFYFRLAEWLHNDSMKFIQFSDNTIIPVGILETVEISTKSDKTINDKYNTIVKFDWEQLRDI